MEQLSKLEQEFIRVKLYGFHPSKRPRKAEVIISELRREWGEKAAEREKELNSIFLQIIEFGQKACEISRNPGDDSELAFESLKDQCAAHSDIAAQFARQCYNDGELPAELQNHVSLSQKKANDTAVSNKKPAKDKPSSAKKITLSDADAAAGIMQSIRGNMPPSSPRANVMPHPAGRKPKEAAWNNTREKIVKCRTWVNARETMLELDSIIRDMERKQSPHMEEACSLLADGKEIARLFDLAKNAAFLESPEEELKTILRSAAKLKATEKEIEKINSQYKYGQIQYQNSIDDKTPRNVPQPDYDPMGPNPHFIGNLTPCPKWTVMIDESGSLFTNAIFTEKCKPQKKGHFVAILIPQGSGLPPIGYFHSSEEYLDPIADKLDKLLHTATPCGILGITLDGMANADVDYWYTGLERLFDLILRLLPLGEKGKTALDIYVEARENSTIGMVKRSLESSRYRLAKVDSARESKFSLELNVISKKDPRNDTFSAWNAYADAFAYSWCCTWKSLHAILQDYALCPTCLMEGSSQNLYEVMDDLKCGRLPKPEYWSELITRRDSGSPDSLVSRLLGSIGPELMDSLPDWRNYLDHLVAHLDSKAIDMRMLGKQISFLRKYQPDDSVLPPRLKLLWLTAKLAESNHRGAVVVEAFDKFTALIHDLYEEDAPLTCYATLHLAVNYTNAYRFQEAQNVVENYLHLITNAIWGKNLPSWVHSVFDTLMASTHIEPAFPAAIPGLRYFAQLISSHGQHEAFFGRNAEAVRYFCEANRLFGRLSVKDDADKEISQTTAYLLTSLMDMDAPDPTLMDNTLKSYFGDDLESAAASLAVTDDPKRKYSLHILMRYILSGKAPANLKSIVLGAQADWKTAPGHPWEMIEFYRGLLLDDPAARMKHLKNACELCKGHDATLHVIQAVILGTILLEDPSVLPQYQALVEQCLMELPYLGVARIAALRDQPQKRLPALELAAIVLPFNFR